MTYYANAPAPAAAPPVSNKQLSALLSQNNLSRRPSKLSPADRLSRPQGPSAAQVYAQAHTAPASIAPSPSSLPHNQHYPPQGVSSQGPNPKINALPVSLIPTHLASAGSSPKGRKDALPAKDSYGAYPGHRQQESNGNVQQPQGSAPLPNVLRPGPGRTTPPSTAASPQPTANSQNQSKAHGHEHVRHPSSPPQEVYSKYGQDEASAPNPYITGSGASPQNPYIAGNTTPPRNHANIGGNTTPNNSSNPYIGGNAPPSNPANLHAGGNVLPANPGLGPGRTQSIAPSPAGPSPYATQAQGTSYTGYISPPPSGPPLLWQQSTSGAIAASNATFSFPMPMIVSPTQEQPQHHSFSTYSEHNVSSTGYGQQYRQHPPPTHRTSSSRDEQTFDPYLQARYQSPLPLPPGASSSTSAAPSRPAPPTPAASAAVLTPAPAAPVTRVPTPPTKVSTPGPDRARVEALRRVEEEASRRREQELKDLELAMQLDRDLNLAEERAAAAAGSEAMPGRWQ
ncbi:hypothetical protein CVT25_010834 [Psilocybe cyanescens]|uniref:Uncharacterized protein n=1 Tax=Psilocybe cyanescens TaxID=93625 RepID=A0A409WF46_PSICY|nr:hypothetical protein CVT25_010834 [Psilocybe cyanescens]